MDIDDYRKEISETDAQLVRLFNRRLRAAEKIAGYKKEHGLPITDRARETAVADAAAAAAEPGLESYTRMLWESIFSITKAYERETGGGPSPLSEKIRRSAAATPPDFPETAAIACQGVPGAYSHRACKKLFRDPDITFFDTWEGVVEAVSDGKARYGVLPIENSTAGSVNRVYDLMKGHSFYIVRSVKLRIEHSLLANEGATLDGIREILSHEQAINQCGGFLSGLNGVRITAVGNTAQAARTVGESGRRDIAAIASPYCAELYGLKELMPSVQDAENNYTRFICMSSKAEIYPGADRTSIMLTTEHRPGALYGVLSLFNARGINLIKLESRPVPGRPFEFSFYFDLETGRDRGQFYRLIDDLTAEGFGCNYFGTYQEV